MMGFDEWYRESSLEGNVRSYLDNRGIFLKVAKEKWKKAAMKNGCDVDVYDEIDKIIVECSSLHRELAPLRFVAIFMNYVKSNQRIEVTSIKVICIVTLEYLIYLLEKSIRELENIYNDKKVSFFDLCLFSGAQSSYKKALNDYKNTLLSLTFNMPKI